MVASQAHAVDPNDSATPLDREAGFDLLLSMFGTFHELYEQSGGVDTVLRERNGGDIHASAE